MPCGQRAGGGSPSGLAERGSGMFIPTVAAPRERRWRRAATVLSGGALLAVAACGLLSENTVRSGLLAYGGYSYGTTYAPAYSPWGAAPAPAYMPQYAQPAQGYGQMLAPAPLPMEGSYQVGQRSPLSASPPSPPAPHRHLTPPPLACTLHTRPLTPPSRQQGIAQSLAPFTSHLQLPSEVGAADGAADGAQGWSTGRVRFELSRVIQEEALSTQVPLLALSIWAQIWYPGGFKVPRSEVGS